MKWEETAAHSLLDTHTKDWEKRKRNSFLNACSRGFYGSFNGSLHSLEMLGRGEIERRGIGAERQRYILDALGISQVDKRLEREFLFLRRTIGCASWLNNLNDEQWHILYNEILPPLHKAELAQANRLIHTVCSNGDDNVYSPS